MRRNVEDGSPVRASHSASDMASGFLCSWFRVKKREEVNALSDTGRTQHFRASM